MKKILLVSLVASFGLSASEAVTVNEVKLELENVTEVSLPYTQAKLSKIISNLIEDAGTNEVIPVSNITKDTWEVLSPCFLFAERIAKNDRNATQDLYVYLRTLSPEEIIDVLLAVNYLDIKVLFSDVVRAAHEKDLRKGSFDKIGLLLQGDRNSLVFSCAVRVLGVYKPAQLALCEGHTDDVYSVCVTGDGKIVSGSHDKTVRVWDMAFNQLAICEGHERWVTSVCVSDDGKIVSGSRDKTVRMWDMAGNQLDICEGHTEEVWSVCVTADGKIVSGSAYGTVRVWDMAFNQLAVCEGHTKSVNSVCIIK